MISFGVCLVVSLRNKNPNHCAGGIIIHSDSDRVQRNAIKMSILLVLAEITTAVIFPFYCLGFPQLIWFLNNIQVFAAISNVVLCISLLFFSLSTNPIQCSLVYVVHMPFVPGIYWPQCCPCTLTLYTFQLHFSFTSSPNQTTTRPTTALHSFNCLALQTRFCKINGASQSSYFNAREPVRLQFSKHFSLWEIIFRIIKWLLLAQTQPQMMGMLLRSDQARPPRRNSLGALPLHGWAS